MLGYMLMFMLCFYVLAINTEDIISGNSSLNNFCAKVLLGGPLKASKQTNPNPCIKYKKTQNLF